MVLVYYLFLIQCKYKPPQGVSSVGQHVELEIGIYLQRYPPEHRHVRRLVFDYLLKRECCITGCDSMEQVDLLGIGSYTELPGKFLPFYGSKAIRVENKDFFSEYFVIRILNTVF